MSLIDIRRTENPFNVLKSQDQNLKADCESDFNGQGEISAYNEHQKDEKVGKSGRKIKPANKSLGAYSGDGYAEKVSKKENILSTKVVNISDINLNDSVSIQDIDMSARYDASKIQAVLDLGKHMEGIKNTTIDSNGSIPGLITARSQMFDDSVADQTNTYDTDQKVAQATFNPNMPG